MPTSSVDEPMGAEVEVRSVIFLAGAGTVVVGHVRSGTARDGQVTAEMALGDGPARRLEVSTVQRLSSMERNALAVGLVFREPPPLNDLKRALPPGSMLQLEEPASAGRPGRK